MRTNLSLQSALVVSATIASLAGAGSAFAIEASPEAPLTLAGQDSSRHEASPVSSPMEPLTDTLDGVGEATPPNSADNPEVAAEGDSQSDFDFSCVVDPDRVSDATPDSDCVSSDIEAIAIGDAPNSTDVPDGSDSTVIALEPQPDESQAAYPTDDLGAGSEERAFIDSQVDTEETFSSIHSISPDTDEPAAYVEIDPIEPDESDRATNTETEGFIPDNDDVADATLPTSLDNDDQPSMSSRTVEDIGDSDHAEDPEADAPIEVAPANEPAASSAGEAETIQLEASTPNGWVTKDGKTYYFTSGKAVTGQKKIDGKWYYFNTADGAEVQSKFVYVSSDKKTRFYGTNGVMKTGKQTIYDYEYSFDTSTGARTDSQFFKQADKTYYYNDLGHLSKGEEYINGKWYFFDPSTGAQMTSAQIIQRVENQARTVLGTRNGVPFEDELMSAGGTLCWGIRGAWCATYIWWSFRHAGLEHFLADGNVIADPKDYFNYYAAQGRSHWCSGANGESMRNVKRGDLVYVYYGTVNGSDITHMAYCIKKDDNGFWCIEGNVPDACVKYRTYDDWMVLGYSRPSY